MIHEEQRMQISQYVDGELDPSAEWQVFDHVSKCEVCQGFLRRSIRLRADMMREILRPQDRPGMDIDSRNALPQRHTRSILRRRISLPVPIAAAIIIALIAGSITLSSLRSKPEIVYVTTFPAVEVPGYMP